MTLANTQTSVRTRFAHDALGRQPDRIIEAAIRVIANHGLAHLTHRSVAVEGSVSLAATTRHYKNKAEIIAIASHRLLNGYIEGYTRAIARQRSGDQIVANIPALIRLLVSNAAGHRRQDSLAWCEVILNAGKSQEGREMAVEWFARLAPCWRDLFAAMGLGEADADMTTAIDVAIGLLFVTLPLGLDPEGVPAPLTHGFSIGLLLPPPPSAGKSHSRSSRKARETRERIINAAIALLIEEGLEALTYQAISTRAKLTVAAPAYHFGSIDGLITATQDRLFTVSRDRYREILSSLPTAPRDLGELVNFTSAIFLREVTEFAAINRATYAIWLEAARFPSLRRSVAHAILTIQTAWTARTRAINPAANDTNGLAALALYIGKLIRITSTGSRTSDLACVHAEFYVGLKAITGRSEAGTFF